MALPAMLGVGGIGAGLLWYFGFGPGKAKAPVPEHPGPVANVNVADIVFNGGTAKPQAMIVYNLLKTEGYPKTPEFQTAVKNFQAAHNSDPNGVKITGKIPVTGVYDTKTSSVLTIYTRDPIPADPDSPLPPIANPSNASDASTWGSVVGNWATSLYNVVAYIYAHGQDGSSTLQQFIRQYQYDFNNDTKSPGPKGAFYTPPVKITTPLAVNGVLDEPTKQTMLRGIGPGIDPNTLKYPATSVVNWTQGSADMNIKPGGIVEAP